MRRHILHIESIYNERELKNILERNHIQLTKVEALDSVYPINLMHKGEFIDSVDVTAQSLEEAKVIAVGLFQKASPYDVSRSPEDPEFLLAHNIDLSKVELDQ